MPLSRPPRARRCRAVLLSLVASAALLTTGTPALAASMDPDTSPTRDTSVASAPGGTGERTAVGHDRTATDAPTAQYTWRRLNISMQAQELTNWCWAATGDTVASYFGYSYSQNQFCNAAFGRAIDSSCPNDQATLANDQRALSWMGVNPGSYVTGYLNYGTIQREIDADRPVMSRIQWSSGGGHMLLVYGYDKSQSWVYWGDPWPSDNRYNWATYDYYVRNGSFSWTHSLYGIGA